MPRRKYLHRFKSEEEYQNYLETGYHEPTVSTTPTIAPLQRVDYNLRPIDLPLTFEILSDGVIRWYATNTGITKTISYSKNGGEWTEITSSTGDSAPSISVVSGDKIRFKGDNSAYAINSSNYNRFVCGAECTIYGNIMSLIDSAGFKTADTLEETNTFNSLFYGGNIIDASNLVLPATALTNSCYSAMFANCTHLTAAPSILPATTLADYCYSSMFYTCNCLTTAPSILPATTLAGGCYSTMFFQCNSLETAPELPATTVASNCCYRMFENCYALVKAPSILPATTLANTCYSDMFVNCRMLTIAPELPATTLTNSCYYSMFSGCTNLNYIKCLATDISANRCTTNWVSGVQTNSGTFVKNPNMSSWGRGYDGIPTNWTVQDNT